MRDLHPAKTPEEALTRLQAAHASEDVELVLDSIDFEGQAIRYFTNRGHQPTPEEILVRATERKTAYRQVLTERGFGKGLNIAKAQVVRKQENSPTQHSFIVQDVSYPDSVTAFVMHFQLSERGWLFLGS